MLRDCDMNMITTPISSSTTNHCPQPQKQIQILVVVDDHKSAMASSAPNKATPIPAPLNCPRCDSSNTKFCYYNNYSLSQPRHFCKACKRYWTRGGTLRNVPVGGGCRKNKRPRRRDSPAAPQIDPPSTHIQNPSFYSTSTTTTSPLELNFPFSSFRAENSTGYDLHPQINSLGLGFSNNSNGGISSSPFSAASANNNSIFFGSSSSPSATMASLLASTLQHQKFASKDIQSPGLMSYDDPQMAGTGRQGENSRPTWNPNPNPIDQININSSDPSSLLWNTAAWFDPSSMGSSSVPSLI